MVQSVNLHLSEFNLRHHRSVTCCVVWSQAAVPQIYIWKEWMGMVLSQAEWRLPRRTWQAKTRSISDLALPDTIHLPWYRKVLIHLSLALSTRYRCYLMYRWCVLPPSSTLMWFNECWHKESSPSSSDLLLCKQVGVLCFRFFHKALCRWLAVDHDYFWWKSLIVLTRYISTTCRPCTTSRLASCPAWTTAVPSKCNRAPTSTSQSQYSDAVGSNAATTSTAEIKWVKPMLTVTTHETVEVLPPPRTFWVVEMIFLGFFLSGFGFKALALSCSTSYHPRCTVTEPRPAPDEWFPATWGQPPSRSRQVVWIRCVRAASPLHAGQGHKCRWVGVAAIIKPLCWNVRLFFSFTHLHLLFTVKMWTLFWKTGHRTGHSNHAMLCLQP